MTDDVTVLNDLIHYTDNADLWTVNAESQQDKIIVIDTLSKHCNMTMRHWLGLLRQVSKR